MFRSSSYEQVTPNGWTKIPERFISVVKNTSYYKDRIIITSIDGCLYAYIVEDWRMLEKRILKNCHDNSCWGPFKSFFISNASVCMFDKEGYLKIPYHLKEYTQIKTIVVMVGNLDRFEIWSGILWYEANLKMNETLEMEEVPQEILSLDLGGDFEDFSSPKEESLLNDEMEILKSIFLERKLTSEDAFENFIIEQENYKKLEDPTQEVNFSDNDFLDSKYFRGRHAGQIYPDKTIKFPDQFTQVATKSEGRVVLTNVGEIIHGYTLNQWKLKGKKNLKALNEIDVRENTISQQKSNGSIYKMQPGGQIQIPESLMKISQIKNYVILLGCLDHFQIVDRKFYQRIINEVEEDMKSEELREEIAALGL